MSTGVKAAAFAAFVRVFLSAFEPLRADWAPLLWVIAVATMIVGTVVGVAQTNVKRMLAYSSIAHAGYLLVGLVAASSVGKAADALLPAGVRRRPTWAPSASSRSSRPGSARTATCATSPGCGTRSPALAVLMTVFLLSLGGFPPTAGFIAKWYMFSAAVQEGYYGLAIIGVLTSVVSVFFYLRIVVMMYMTDARAVEVPQPSAGWAGGLAVAALAIFYLGDRCRRASSRSRTRRLESDLLI